MLKYRNCIENLSAYIPGKPIDDVKKEYGLDSVVKLASNENPFGASPLAKSAYLEAVDTISIYPDGNATALKEAISEKYNVLPDNIIPGCGTDEVIYMIGKTFIDPGDECITGEITFSQYAASVDSMGGKMIYVPLKNYTFDLDGIYGRISDKTKVIFLANPNNPTGTSYSQSEQAAFIKKVPSNILIVIDEAYAEYVRDENYPDTLNELKQYKNIMLLKTFSKIYGLASLRVGYGIANSEIIEKMNRIRGPFNVSAPGQLAAAAALKDTAFVEKTYEENRKALEYLYNAFDGIGLNYIPSQSNFVMVEPGMDCRVVFIELMKRGYIVRPCAPFGLDSYIRLSTGTSGQMEGFVKALKEVIKK